MATALGVLRTAAPSSRLRFQLTYHAVARAGLASAPAAIAVLPPPAPRRTISAVVGAAPLPLARTRPALARELGTAGAHAPALPPPQRLRVFAAYVAQRIDVARFAKRAQAEWRLPESAVKVEKDWATIRVPYDDFAGNNGGDGTDGGGGGERYVAHSYISVSRRGAIVVTNAPPHLRRAATAAGTGLFDAPHGATHSNGNGVVHNSGALNGGGHAHGSGAISLEPLLRDRTAVSGLMFDVASQHSQQQQQQQQQPITEDLTVVLQPPPPGAAADVDADDPALPLDSTSAGAEPSQLPPASPPPPPPYCTLDRRGDLVLSSSELEPEAVRILASVLAQSVNLHHFEGQVERMYEVVGDVFALLQHAGPDGVSAAGATGQAQAGGAGAAAAASGTPSGFAAVWAALSSPRAAAAHDGGAVTPPASAAARAAAAAAAAAHAVRPVAEPLLRAGQAAVEPPLRVVRQMVAALGFNVGGSGSGGRPTDTAQLYRWLGATNAIANAIMLSGLRSITIRPGSTAWNEPRFAGMHEILEGEFDLGERYEQLERRLEYVSESLKYALEVAKDTKSLALERLIVWLIAAELAISLVSSGLLGDAARAVLG